MDGIPLTSLHPPAYQPLPANFMDIVKAALSSPNEVAFRRAVAEPLIHARVEPKLRQAALTQAVSMYRARPVRARPTLTPRIPLQKARGGKYHSRHKVNGRWHYNYTKHPTGKEARVSWLKEHVQRILDKHEGEDDTLLERLRETARRYGHAEVARAINACGGYDRLKACLKKGKHVAAPGAGGLGGGSEGTPPGTRKVWNNVVVEKQPDGKWKKVSHVAGLEGERVPRKRKRELTDHLKDLTKEQAEILLQKLREKKGKKPEEPSKGSDE